MSESIPPPNGQREAAPNPWEAEQLRFGLSRVSRLLADWDKDREADGIEMQRERARAFSIVSTELKELVRLADQPSGYRLQLVTGQKLTRGWVFNNPSDNRDRSHMTIQPQSVVNLRVANYFPTKDSPWRYGYPEPHEFYEVDGNYLLMKLEVVF